MKTLADLLGFIVTMLQAWPRCQAVRILETNQFAARQFAVKLRAELTSGAFLQIRLYRNEEHLDYAYQLVHNEWSVRWDNKEHFPSLRSYPHHFHGASGQVETSPLTCEPLHDLPLVLNWLADFFGQE